MKNLSEAQLDDIQQMAGRLIHPRLIAIAVDMDELEFTLEVNNPSSEIHRRYYAGFIQAKVDLHEKIIQSAMNGSSPSQADVKKFIKEAEDYLNG